MRPVRTLALRRDALTDLDAGDLLGVVGGTHVGCVTHGNTCDACDVPTLPVNDCIRDVTSAFAASVICIPPTNGC